MGLALITAYGYYAYMKNLGVLTDTGWFAMIVIMACYCGGASLIMWLADKIDENGIGNGISIILFVNILSSGYATAQTIINQIQKGGFANIFFAILSVIIMIAVITLVVFITNSERRIPVQYAKRVVGRKMYGGQNSNLPLKLNMSGVMPESFLQAQSFRFLIPFPCLYNPRADPSGINSLMFLRPIPLFMFCSLLPLLSLFPTSILKSALTMLRLPTI